MFHGGAEYSTEIVKWSTDLLYPMETVKCSTEVLNIQRRVSNVPTSSQILHGNGKMFHPGAKYSMESVKCSTEVLNIPCTVSNVWLSP